MPWLGTVVIEESGHEVTSVRLDQGSVLVEFVIQGPFDGLPIGIHHYMVVDWQKNLVFRGAVEFDVPVLAPGERLSHEIRLEIGSGKDTKDRRSFSIVDSSPVVRDEQETIATSLYPSRVAFLGFRCPDGSLSDRVDDPRAPRVYQIG